MCVCAFVILTGLEYMSVDIRSSVRGNFKPERQERLIEHVIKLVEGTRDRDVGSHLNKLKIE